MQVSRSSIHKNVEEAVDDTGEIYKALSTNDFVVIYNN